MAQGLVYLVATLFVYHAWGMWGALCSARLSEQQSVLQPVCSRPVAIETRRGLTFGCLDEPQLALCHAQAFDRVRLGGGGCTRVANAMPSGWYTPLGYKLDINRARPQDLEALPHIGQKTAHAIVRYRQENGPFSSSEALGAVHGVGPARVREMRAFVTVAE